MTSFNPKEVTSIPSLFCQTDTNKPFSTCLVCDSTLLDTAYVVEKVIQNLPTPTTEEVLFESAICWHCLNTMQQELSKVSAKKINDYIRFHRNLNKREGETQGQSKEVDRLRSQTDWCLVKRTPVKSARTYAVYALCKGHSIFYSDLPYALCEEALEEIHNLLSVATRDVLDDFVEQHFSGPAEVMDILKGKPVLL